VALIRARAQITIFTLSGKVHGNTSAVLTGSSRTLAVENRTIHRLSLADPLLTDIVHRAGVPIIAFGLNIFVNAVTLGIAAILGTGVLIIACIQGIAGADMVGVAGIPKGTAISIITGRPLG
tara:strand:- start:443 stop:808 length:366 start_codon:yes stop_codon:yes gene_type:complete